MTNEKEEFFLKGNIETLDSTRITETFVEKDLNYYLRMIRGDYSELEETHMMKAKIPSAPKNIVVLITSNQLGIGKEDVGKRLLKHFLRSLVNQRVKPKAIIFMNSAVELAVSDDPQLLGSLTMLEEQTVKIMICAISLDEYGLEEQTKVGIVSDMDTILENILSAWKVISL